MILYKILFLQLAAAAVIVFVLLELFKHELVRAALEALEQAEFQEELGEVSVVAGTILSPDDEFRLRALLRKRFPSAEVCLAVNREIRGGLVIQAGALLLDYSFLTRIKNLFRDKDA